MALVTGLTSPGQMVEVKESGFAIRKSTGTRAKLTKGTFVSTLQAADLGLLDEPQETEVSKESPKAPAKKVAAKKAPAKRAASKD